MRSGKHSYIGTINALHARCRHEPGSTCWHWIGAQATDGMPRIHTFDHRTGQKRTLTGGRAAWNIAYKCAPPEGKLVFRRCGEQACVNPSHLLLASSKKEIGAHIRQAGWRVGTHVEQRRATQRMAMQAAGVTPTPREIVLAIREAQGLTLKAIGAMYGLSHQTVSRIRRGEAHRGVA